MLKMRTVEGCRLFPFIDSKTLVIVEVYEQKEFEFSFASLLSHLTFDRVINQ